MHQETNKKVLNRNLGLLKVPKYLVEKSLDIKTKNSSGWMALIISSYYGNQKYYYLKKKKIHLTNKRKLN